MRAPLPVLTTAPVNQSPAPGAHPGSNYHHQRKQPPFFAGAPAKRVVQLVPSVKRDTFDNNNPNISKRDTGAGSGGNGRMKVRYGQVERPS